MKTNNINIILADPVIRQEFEHYLSVALCQFALNCSERTRPLRSRPD